MEERIEDYINFMGSASTSAENKVRPTKKEVVVSLEKQKEYSSRALKIVEFLIDGKLRPETFLRSEKFKFLVVNGTPSIIINHLTVWRKLKQASFIFVNICYMLKHIDQAYYNDVVEERAISKLCGYAICNNKIPDMPKQRYFISTKSNKVYDITERKNYCSNFCYKGSTFIKNQIPTSPLWLRTAEEIPQFTLLPATVSGSPGKLIDQGIVKPIENPEFTSVSSFASASLEEVSDAEHNKKTKITTKTLKNPLQTITEKEIEENEKDSNVPYSSSLKQKNYVALGTKICKKTKSLSIDTIKEEVIANADTDGSQNAKTLKETVLAVQNSVNVRTEKAIQNVVLPKPVPTQETARPTSMQEGGVLEIVKQNLYEWITIETYIFLYGEAKIKVILEENQLAEYLETLKINEAQLQNKAKYIELCRKLHLKELAEQKFDNIVVKKQLQPLPDYEKLKEEGDRLKIRVKAFYGGGLLGVEETMPASSSRNVDEGGCINTEEGAPAVLPLVDTSSQTALRRKIFLTSISKTMYSVVQQIGLSESDILNDVRLLVRTFNLQAHNVIFKPVIGYIIAIIFLKLLSIRDEDLKLQLQSERVQSNVNLLLDRFPNGEVFVNDLVKNMEDVDLFVRNYIGN